MSVDNSHACIPDQMSVQQMNISNQPSREEDSA